MIGPVQQKRFDEIGIARDVARAQARRIRALRQAAEHGQAFEIHASERLRRGERAERGPRLVEINFGVALIGGNDESMSIR